MTNNDTATEVLVPVWVLETVRSNLLYISKEYDSLIDQLKKSKEALLIAKTRLEICSDRMQACHEETGNHELRDECIMFADEISVTLSKLTI